MLPAEHRRVEVAAGRLASLMSRDLRALLVIPMLMLAAIAQLSAPSHLDAAPAESPLQANGKPLAETETTPGLDEEHGQTNKPAEELAERQRDVAKKFERLEHILLRMSELTAASDPRRAALLTKAVAESRERLIGVQFAALIDQLSKDELAKAIEGQERLDADLGDLLKLLLSENRSKRLASEKARIRQYLQQLNRIINQQKGLQARTVDGAGQPQELAKQQEALGQQTGGLAEEIRNNEEQQGKAGAEKAGKDDSRHAQGEQENAENSSEESGQDASKSGEDTKTPDTGKASDPPKRQRGNRRIRKPRASQEARHRTRKPSLLRNRPIRPANGSTPLANECTKRNRTLRRPSGKVQAKTRKRQSANCSRRRRNWRRYFASCVRRRSNRYSWLSRPVSSRCYRCNATYTKARTGSTRLQPMG